MRPEERCCEAMSPALAVIGCALDVGGSGGIGCINEARCGAADYAVVFRRDGLAGLWIIRRDPDGV